MRVLTLLLVVAALSVSCTTSTTTPEPAPDYVLLASQTVDGVTVELFADQSFRAGYNPVYVKVVKNGARVETATVQLAPLMDMGMMKHSCPVEQPDQTANAYGYFAGAVVFTMAGTSDQWSLDVTVDDPALGFDHTITFPVNVDASSNVVVAANGMERTIFTLVDKPWKTGMNDVQVLLHRTTDGHEFHALEGETLHIDPTMPSMGHGSSGNVHPVHHQHGWYHGKVNFTMTGDWDIAVMTMAEGMPKQTAHFAVEVK